MFQAGDIFLVAGTSFFAKGIRFFTRGRGEAPTKATHVGIIVSGSSPADTVVVEALGSGVVRRPFLQGPGKESHAVYRPLNISLGAIAAGVAVAHYNVGRKYGWLKIAAQVLDWLIPYRDKKGNPPFAVRRLFGHKRFPFCSFLADEVVGEMLAYDLRRALEGTALEDADIKAQIQPFGVPRNACSPDDIMDYVEIHPDKYRCVRLMGKP